MCISNPDRTAALRGITILLTRLETMLGTLKEMNTYQITPTIDLSQIHGKPWYPMSCTFLSLKTVEFYSKPHGLLPHDFNLGQI